MGDSFYKDHYDVIVVGGALAGMSCALSLAKEGKSVLILEKHNLPGGVATSFVRNGVEIEASLHEMMSIGPEEHPFSVRAYLENLGVEIPWLKIPEAYRVYLPSDGIDIVLHAGIDDDGVYVAAKEIDAVYPGNKEKVDRLLHTCKEIMDSTNYMNEHHVSKLDLVKDHWSMTATAGYSASEVLDAMGIPKPVQAILSAYWIYVGQPMSSLPFTIYGYLMGDYMTGGSYFPRYFSHGMALSMALRCQQLGVQIEYGVEVDKILVNDGRAYGVKTKRGDVIRCKYVVSGVYPDAVFGKMIEPLSEVPPKAYKLIHGRKEGVSCFSVILVLDKTSKELGIEDYSVFDADVPFDCDKFWEEGKRLGPWHYLTTICLDQANPDAFPEGKCTLSITELPLPESFYNVKADEYFEVRRKLAKELIEHESKRIGVNLFDHIVDIEIETPVSVSHYVGQYRGGIYGYQHTMEDAVAARLFTYEKEHYIKNLTWASAASLAGDGMAVCINNGAIAAKTILDWDKKGK